MKINELREDTLIIDWLGNINASKNTENSYLLAMQSFTNWVDKKPEELVTEAEEEESKASLKKRLRSIRKYFIGFRKYLQDKGLAPLTVKTYISGVKSFYRTFDIEIPMLPRSGNKAVSLEENKDIPTKEDLQHVLSVCDPLERAILLVGASSGLSANEIINLKVKDFKTGSDKKTEITTLKLRREKTKVDFVTFLSPEASRAVQKYLDYRERTIKTGETRRLHRLDKQKVLSDDDYLFISRHIYDASPENKKENERKLKHDSFMKMYKGISEKARMNTVKGNWNIIRSHNIRKYFNSALLNANADSFFVEFCMGHTLDSTKAAYFRANPEQLRETYSKYIPFLTIQKALDVSESPDFQRIKNENQALVAETVKHMVERQEMRDMHEQLEQTKAEKQELENKIDNFMAEVLDEIDAKFLQMMKASIEERRVQNVSLSKFDLAAKRALLKQKKKDLEEFYRCRTEQTEGLSEQEKKKIEEVYKNAKEKIEELENKC